MTPEEVKETKAEIKRLVAKLPGVEAQDYDLLMMTYELQEEIKLLIQNNTKDEADDVQNLLETAFKKQKAIGTLKELNKELKEIWNSLDDEEKIEFDSAGLGVKKVMKFRHQQKLKDAKHERETRQQTAENESANGQDGDRVHNQSGEGKENIQNDKRGGVGN